MALPNIVSLFSNQRVHVFLKDLDVNTEISASNGQHMLALTVFAHALSFFRLRALLEISDQSGAKVTSDDIRWIVTVPAIWHDPAKQFMRLAAYQVTTIDVTRSSATA